MVQNARDKIHSVFTLCVKIKIYCVFLQTFQKKFGHPMLKIHGATSSKLQSPKIRPQERLSASQKVFPVSPHFHIVCAFHTSYSMLLFCIAKGFVEKSCLPVLIDSVQPGRARCDEMARPEIRWYRVVGPHAEGHAGRLQALAPDLVNSES